jgi:hypothetical protein
VPWNLHPKISLVSDMNKLKGITDVVSEHLSLTDFVRLSISIAFLIIGFVPQSRAGDFWKDKSFDSWTMKEARAIQTDSPWSRKIVKDAPWIKGNVGYLSILPVGCDGRPDISDRGAPLQLDTPTYTRVEYKVNWISSRTMRSAKAQEAILCGKTNKDTAEEVLEEAVDEYRIEIVSPDMMPFESMEEEEIRQNTSLTFKKAQKKVTAHDVVIRRITGQKRIISMVFMFEKKSENDEAYLTPDEKEIEFLSRAGNFSIKVKFQPAKMSTKDGPDL